MTDSRRGWTKCKLVIPNEHAEVHPWSADGPGWANAGLYLREPNESGLGECVYEAQLGPRASVLFPVALAAIGALHRALMAEGYLKERP